MRRFCERQGFRRSTTDHDFYDKVLTDESTAGTKISLGIAETETVPEPLPEHLTRHLREERHLPEEEIAALSRIEAQRLLNARYSGERAEP